MTLNKTLLELLLVAILTNAVFIFCKIIELGPLHIIIFMFPFTAIGLSYVFASHKHRSQTGDKQQ